MKSSALSLKGLFAPEHAVPKGVSKTSRDFGEQLKWCLQFPRTVKTKE